MNTLSINPADIPMPKVHEYLLSAIAPRPIAFVSTIDEAGVANLAPFSFFNVFGSNPPTLIFSPARSGRTGATKNTHDNVLFIKECVINIAHYDMLHQMNLAAGMYEKGVNEFEKSGLTPEPSLLVKPPRVKECYVQFECEVKQVIETGTGGGAGNLIICEVKMIHINEKVLNEEGSIDPIKMNYIARLGKQFWCRIGEENIITIPGFKMANELGMGWNALPEHIRHSPFLSANDVALLASLPGLPTAEAIEEIKAADFVKELFEEHKNNTSSLTKAIHQRAKVEIERGSLELGLKLLIID